MVYLLTATKSIHKLFQQLIFKLLSNLYELKYHKANYY